MGIVAPVGIEDTIRSFLPGWDFHRMGAEELAIHLDEARLRDEANADILRENIANLPAPDSDEWEERVEDWTNCLSEARFREETNAATIRSIMAALAEADSDQWVATPENLAALSYDQATEIPNVFSDANTRTASSSPARRRTVGYVDPEVVKANLRVRLDLTFAHRRARHGKTFENSIAIAKKRQRKARRLGGGIQNFAAEIQNIRRLGYPRLTVTELNWALYARSGPQFESRIKAARRSNKSARALGVGDPNFEARFAETKRLTPKLPWSDSSHPLQIFQTDTQSGLTRGPVKTSFTTRDHLSCTEV